MDMASYSKNTNMTYNSTLVHKSCNATKCLCPFKEKRNYQIEFGSWEIILCHTCNLYGTHRICSFLQCFQNWRCKTCNDGAGMEEKRLLSQNRGMAVHLRGAPSATLPDASAGILERRTCTIEKCLCPYKQNRKHQEKIGSWEILLCGTCGIYGTHRICSFVKCFQAWHCTACQAKHSGIH
ncbi:PHD finger protein 7-like [Metopolophium dirhodum]|uniref:PHD finger protein 7-like n=1 Tax=Metopolophium dirhodum TaxID=44670 RepID=UPI00299065B4|nr:PHD finger protein 7-like [Metopolophium dirhodum]